MFTKGTNTPPTAKHEYITVKEVLTNEEIGEYITYGIKAMQGSEELAYVSDISTDKEAVEKLAKRCTEHGLSPEHLLDVVEDFLAEDMMLI